MNRETKKGRIYSSFFNGFRKEPAKRARAIPKTTTGQGVKVKDPRPAVKPKKTATFFFMEAEEACPKHPKKKRQPQVQRSSHIPGWHKRPMRKGQYPKASNIPQRREKDLGKKVLAAA